LIQEELRQPVVGAACGGTHRLMGYSYALSRAKKENLPISGIWQQAANFAKKYQVRAVMLRNRDGSCSTEWFKGRGFDKDVERRLRTSGHIMEWLVFSLPQSDLQDPRIMQSIEYLTDLMMKNRNRDWEVGQRGHALRALALYDQRVFGGELGRLEERLSRMVPRSQRLR
jgi:hypothetical protein